MKIHLALTCLLACSSSLSGTVNAFSTTTPWSARRVVGSKTSTSSSSQGRRATTSRVVESAATAGVLDEDCMITPEGFGFSAPARRILKEANRGGGFHKATSQDLVIDVMEAITTGQKDVALVFGKGDDKDDGVVQGLFTETDYIKVRTELLNMSLGEGSLAPSCRLIGAWR